MKKAGPRLSIIPAAAVTDERLTPRALQVLCLLGRHTDNGGWCRVRQTLMADELKISRSTVQAALDLLYETGWVECEARGRPGCAAPDSEKQPYASHAYRVILDPPAEPPAEEAAEQVPEESGTPPEGARPIGHGVPMHASAPNKRPFGNVAAAACGAISEAALRLAAELAVIAGHPRDPPGWPPSWCGAPMRIQGWLDRGWAEPVIVIGARTAAARKAPATIRTVEFFEGAIADEIARQSRPLPTGDPNAKTHVRSAGRRGASHSTLARDYARRASEAGGSGSG